MTTWLILAIGVVYVVVAIDLLLQNKVGMAIAFVGYAIGNLGLYIESRV